MQFAFDFIDKEGLRNINFQDLRLILAKDDNSKEVEQIIEEIELGDGNININGLTFEKFEETMNNYLNKIEEKLKIYFKENI